MTTLGFAATVAVAVHDGHRSRRAARWAAQHLGPHSARVVLVHVIPSVSSIPSPSGERVPVEEIDGGVVAMFVHDQKVKAREVFFPFLKLFGTKNVETLVLDGESPAAALLRYVAETGTRNLVLGSSSMGWIRRVLKGSDTPSTVLKSAPDCCNVFAVSRRKLTVKFASQSVMGGPDVCREVKTISRKSYSQKKASPVFQKQTCLCTSNCSEISQLSSAHTNNGYCLQAASARGSSETGLVLPLTRYHEEGNFGLDNLKLHALKKSDDMASFRNAPAVLLHGTKEVEATAEVVRLRLELQNTLTKYNQTCEELVNVKRQVEKLSEYCSQESKKVKDALERERVLKQIAAEEKDKHLKVIREVQEAKEVLAKEALDRQKAEIIASELSSEKSKVADAFFLNDKRCRIFSRNEIEVATDNFSDSNKIGEGSYGNVYKCSLDHTPVAIKVLRQGTSDKKEEFLREVEVLSQLRHPHMLLLLGVCPENGCLVYEYMANGSLEDQLFYRKDKQPLPWFIRFRIIFEVACGLAFLHGTKPDPIVHRDLKPGNILLDRNYVSKIGDVGLAKLLPDIVPDGLTEYKETILAGTLYYMDPEYQRTGTVRPKSDLYALGIIALQLLTAEHPKGLVINVEKAIKDGSFATILDKSISDWPLVEAEKLAKLALKCSRLRCRDRPDLEAEVMPELEELLNMANVCFKLRRCNIYAPSHYLCPILQEVMDDPYIAADGFTYEYKAIKSWLEKHKISPATKLPLPHTGIIPNHSLFSAIQEWKAHAAFSLS